MSQLCRQSDRSGHTLSGRGRQAVGSPRINAVRYSVLDLTYATGALARALWLSGRADEATKLVDEYLQEPSVTGHPLVNCAAILDTISVSIWTGQSEVAARAVDELIRRAAQHSLTPYRAIGEGWKAELAYRNGNLEKGIVLLRECLNAVGIDKHQVLTLAFSCYLAEALALHGEFAAALACIDDALTQSEIRRRSYRLAEVFRIKGDILAATPNGDEQAAETCYLESLALARASSALAWELLSTMGLARLWGRQGRLLEARAALAAVYARFDQGFATADLRAARALLDAMPVATLTGDVASAL